MAGVTPLTWLRKHLKLKYLKASVCAMLDSLNATRLAAATANISAPAASDKEV